jgi:hypothetical protein
LRNPGRSETNSQRVHNLSSNDGGPGRKRQEQAIHAYYRLYKNELQPEIDRDFARQVDSISQVAHRNRFLALKFSEASDEVKENVNKNRLAAGDVTRKEVQWADADEISEEEIQRRNAALAINEYVIQVGSERVAADNRNREIGVALRTIDRATDIMQKMTGWNATVVLGGPDPKRGGGIHVVA